jgi:hypothetical protein
MRRGIRAAAIGRQGAAILQLDLSHGISQCRSRGKSVVYVRFVA